MAMVCHPRKKGVSVTGIIAFDGARKSLEPAMVMSVAVMAVRMPAYDRDKMQVGMTNAPLGGQLIGMG